MEITLAVFGIIIGVILIVVGLAGCLFPVLPGPPIAFLALVSLQLTGAYDYNLVLLIVMGLVCVVTAVLDNFISLYGVKQAGGSKAGLWGGTIGLVIGLIFFPPLGIILGPFVGAIVGELSVQKTRKEAFRSGIGSLLGFLGGTLFKTLVTTIVIGFFVYGVIL